MLQIDHLIITRKDWKNVIPEDRFLLLKNDLQKNHDIYKETFLYCLTEASQKDLTEISKKNGRLQNYFNIIFTEFEIWQRNLVQQTKIVFASHPDQKLKVENQQKMCEILLKHFLTVTTIFHRELGPLIFPLFNTNSIVKWEGDALIESRCSFEFKDYKSLLGHAILPYPTLILGDEEEHEKFYKLFNSGI